MRTTAVVTISLPPKMVAWTERTAKLKHMTRSELLRTALRAYLEQQDALSAIREYKQEFRSGTLKELKGSLGDLME